jgi:hypothetical protein
MHYIYVYHFIIKLELPVSKKNSNPTQTLALRVVQRTPSEKRHPFFEPFTYVRETKKKYSREPVIPIAIGTPKKPPQKKSASHFNA